MGFMAFFSSCKHEPYSIDPGIPPPIPSASVCFESDILPLIVSGCAKSGCHDVTSANEGYVLTNYQNIMKKGIKPGNANESKLYQVLFNSGNDRMPQPPNLAFTAAQKSLIAQWINEGAKNTTNCNPNACDTTTVTYSKNIKPIIEKNCQGCHNATTANGGYNFMAYSGLKVVVDNKKLLGSIKYQAGFKGMPQGYKLNDYEISTVRI